MYMRTRSEGFGAEVKRRIMIGTYALSAGYYDAYYAQAQRTRTLIIQDFAQAFGRFDFLISPTSPTVAFKIGERTADPLAMYLSDLCTIPVNLAALPGISIPAGLLGRAAGGPADHRARTSPSRGCWTRPTPWSRSCRSTSSRRSRRWPDERRRTAGRRSRHGPPTAGKRSSASRSTCS